MFVVQTGDFLGLTNEQDYCAVPRIFISGYPNYISSQTTAAVGTNVTFDNLPYGAKFSIAVLIDPSKTPKVFAAFCLSVCFSVCVSVCLSGCLCVCLSVCLYVCQSVCLSVCFSVYLFVCLTVCLSVCLSVADDIMLINGQVVSLSIV